MPWANELGIPYRLALGPPGLALNDDVAFVHNHFEGTLAVVDRAEREVSAVVSLFDPVPDEVQQGRAHMYDTHLLWHEVRSHVRHAIIDSRMDRLAWDLATQADPCRPST